MTTSPPEARSPDDGRTLSRRERNKSEKLRRIKAAAHQLFVTAGYDDTTTARIADAADIGMSTLFFYAEDKRDLLFMIWNDFFEPALDGMEASIDPADDVVDALAELFQPLYAHHRREPKLSRATLRELNFASTGTQRERFGANSTRVIALIAAILEQGRQKGEIGQHFDEALGAALVFATYQAEIRRHMSSDTETVAAGLKRLRASFALLVGGLGPASSRAQG